MPSLLGSGVLVVAFYIAHRLNLCWFFFYVPPLKRFTSEAEESVSTVTAEKTAQTDRKRDSILEN